MKRRRSSIRFPRPWTVILVILLPGPIIKLLLWGANSVQKRHQSEDRGVRADVTTIRAALDSYAVAHAGNYPDSLAVLVDADANEFRYMNPTSVPRDPWGREYVYVRGESVHVITYGRDGVPGGTGDDADIDSESMANGR